MTPGAGGEDPGPQGDQLILVVSTEKGAACHSLPSQVIIPLPVIEVIILFPVQKLLASYTAPDVFSLNKV